MTWDAPPRRGAICLSSAECNLGTWTHRFGEHGPGRTASWSRGGRTSEDPSSWNGLNCKVSSQVFTRSWCPQNHQKDATSKLQKWLEGLIAWIVLALKMLAYVYVFVNCVTSLLMAKGPSKQLQLGCWRLVILAAPVANWCQFDMGRICSVLNHIKPGRPKNMNACFDFYMPRILRYSSAKNGDVWSQVRPVKGANWNRNHEFTNLWTFWWSK